MPYRVPIPFFRRHAAPPEAKKMDERFFCAAALEKNRFDGDFISVPFLMQEVYPNKIREGI